MAKKLFFNYYLLTIFYRIALDIIFFKSTQAYSYMGFEFNPRSLEVYLSTHVVCLAFVGLIKKRNTPSSLILFVILLLNIVPAFTLFSLNSDYSLKAIFFLSLTFLVVGLAIHFIEPIKNVNFLKTLKDRDFKRMIFFLYLLFIGILISELGLRFSLPSLENVYSVRSIFKENVTRGTAYVFNWFGSILNPFVFLFALKNKKVLILIITIALQIYLYSLGGHKTMLFTLVVVYGLYLFLIRSKDAPIQKPIMLSISLLLYLLIIFDLVSQKYSLLTAVIGQRVFLIPSQMYFLYFDFFQTNPIDYFSQNFPFSLFANSHYESTIPLVIGEEFYGRPVVANANIFADGYANLGFSAIFFILIVFVPVLIVLDSLVKRKKQEIVLPIIVLLSFSLANGSLITSLFTFGITFFMFLVKFLPRENMNLQND